MIASFLNLKWPLRMLRFLTPSMTWPSVRILISMATQVNGLSIHEMRRSKIESLKDSHDTFRLGVGLVWNTSSAYKGPSISMHQYLVFRYKFFLTFNFVKTL